MTAVLLPSISITFVCLLPLLLPGAGAAPAAALPAQEAGRPAGVIDVAEAGFRTPESVVHDPAADVYLVSNINGGPSEKANNGFISRVAPDGTVIALRWIEAQKQGVTLHAPKGLALHQDRLYATDIDCVRMFHRESGAPRGEICIEDAVFLNDPAVGPDGTLYVTDTGIRIGPDGVQPAGTQAVYRIDRERRVTRIAQGPELQNPNGIVVHGADVLVVPFGGNEIYRLDREGRRSTVAQLPAGQLDGLVRLEDGTLLASSWEGQAVYRAHADGRVDTIIENVPSPADIGWDAKRRRILIPVFTEDRLLFHPMAAR